MRFFYPHRYWIAVLLFAVMLIFGSTPMLGFLRNEAAQHLAEIQAARKATELALNRLEDDVATTQKLSGQIGAEEIEKSLAPVDRLLAADTLEKLATAARLSHFTYTLSAEQKLNVRLPEAGTQELAVSTVTVKADAPLDSDVWAYIERLQSSMPGRMRPQEITLERIASPDTPLAADNLRLTATFEWLSNGVAKEMAEGR